MRRAVAAAALAALTTAASAQDVNVKLSYIVDHPAIDATREGIIATLSDGGFAEGAGMRLEVQSAQGSMPTQVQINEKFVGDGADLIIAISTPSAQTAMAATRDIPIVFAAVTDPLAANLVDTVERPGRNATGSSDMSPIDRHIGLMERLIEPLKTIGVIYNAGEANSVAQVDALKAAAAASGFDVAEATAAQSGGVLDAARSLVGRADVIYVPTDSTAVSGIEAIVRVGRDADLPVVAADTASVERGAAAALGLDYFEIGRAAGELAVAILNGADPAALPVRFADKLELHVNPASAQAMGLTLPDDVISEATRVIE